MIEMYRFVQNIGPLATISRNGVPNIVQRSVAMCLRCGEIYNDDFIANLW